MKPTKFVLLISLLALAGCGPKTPTSIEELVAMANSDDGRYYSNVILDHDADGRLVFYGNYDNPPSDLGDLEAVRASIRENGYFGDLTYDDGENHWSYSRHIDGSSEVLGDIVFTGFDGGAISLDQYEDGAVFLGKRSSDLTYIAPLSLSFSELYYIGQVTPLGY